jgi:hypothetical protein
MAEYTTWITGKDGRVHRVRQVPGDKSPGPEWRQVPNDWLGSKNGAGGNPGDDLSWFDADGRRIPDSELIENGTIEDNRGRWHHKEKIGESMLVHRLGDPCPGEEWTQEEPLKDEPHQKWDPEKKKFVVDEEKKEKAEKEKRISEKKNAIQTAEQRIQRSLIAKMSGKATSEDEEYFDRFSTEIEALRVELKQIEE